MLLLLPLPLFSFVSFFLSLNVSFVIFVAFRVDLCCYHHFRSFRLIFVSLPSYVFRSEDIVFSTICHLYTYVFMWAFFSLLVALIVSLNMSMCIVYAIEIDTQRPIGPRRKRHTKRTERKEILCHAMCFECDSKTIVTNNNVKQSNKHAANKKSPPSGSFELEKWTKKNCFIPKCPRDCMLFVHFFWRIEMSWVHMELCGLFYWILTEIFSKFISN